MKFHPDAFALVSAPFWDDALLKRHGANPPAKIGAAITAMRADTVPDGHRGLWRVHRTPVGAALENFGAFDRYPWLEKTMVSLSRLTDKLQHKTEFGEAVMSDDPRELQRHLPIILKARGRVLVSGLGLGCVVRGLLASSAVDHVDVVELDPHVLELVAPTFAGVERLTIHEGDALTIGWPAGVRWDYAWHDIWSEEPGTQVVHTKLLLRYRDQVGFQGAWALPRWLGRRYGRVGRLL